MVLPAQIPMRKERIEVQLLEIRLLLKFSLAILANPMELYPPHFLDKK